MNEKLKKVLRTHPSEWTLSDAMIVYRSQKPRLQPTKSNWMKFNTIVSNKANEYYGTPKTG